MKKNQSQNKIKFGIKKELRIKKKMLKNIFAKNHQKNLHKHPGPPFQIRPGQGYFSRAQKIL